MVRKRILRCHDRLGYIHIAAIKPFRHLYRGFRFKTRLSARAKREVLLKIVEQALLVELSHASTVGLDRSEGHAKAIMVKTLHAKFPLGKEETC